MPQPTRLSVPSRAARERIRPWRSQGPHSRTCRMGQDEGRHSYGVRAEPSYVLLAGGCMSPCGPILHFVPVVVASSMMPLLSTVKLIMQFVARKKTCDFGPVTA